jgi:predicted nucleotidyltransferase
MIALMTHKEEAKLFIKILKEHFVGRLVSAVLFGSAGRGEEKADSDIDLIVVLKDLPQGRLSRRELLEPVHRRFFLEGGSLTVNSHLKTPQEAEKITVMYFDLPTDAQVLFDEARFFQKIIERVSLKIKENGAVRRKIGRFYYWDLRPGRKSEEVFDIL